MSKLNKAILVYLAGGMRSNWRAEVKDAVNAARKNTRGTIPPVIWLDPCDHGCGDDEQSYTSWDLTAVEASNVIFTYMEADNPAGHGLCVEIGYARGLERSAPAEAARTIIFACERDTKPYRYLGMARVCSDFVLDSLRPAIEELVRVLRESASADSAAT